MADIIEVATHEFSEKGLAGARIDVIAEAMRTSKRMIYYYFGSKEGLYIRVLEEAYRRIRAIESELHLEDLAPEDALRKLVGFTVDYQLANPDFIRLVMTENIHRGEFLAQSKAIQKLNVPAIDGGARGLPARREGRRVPRRHRPGGPAHVDQRVELLQHRQPPHLRADLQARHGVAGRRRGAARQHHRDGRALRAQVARAAAYRMPRSTCAVSRSSGSSLASICSRDHDCTCKVMPIAARVTPRRSFSGRATPVRPASSCCSTIQ